MRTTIPRNFASIILLVALLVLGAEPIGRAADYIWIEGESPQSQPMTRRGTTR